MKGFIVKSKPPSALHVFIIALFLLTIGMNIGDGDWGDAADGAALVFWFGAWSVASRRADAFENAFNLVAGRRS